MDMNMCQLYLPLLQKGLKDLRNLYTCLRSRWLARFRSFCRYIAHEGLVDTVEVKVRYTCTISLYQR
eukprot:NODE_26683_length_542_cov_1.648193.p2 GENE.NODE_26683_length_542_cov_1.648193~~NODE_26683_length_542_cov_1.648193.p2  ORF type:complete len:67 (+),score=4.76 NODE_26683_length_542_cov_1.648193:224-424(+)